MNNIASLIQELLFESAEFGELLGVQKALKEGADVHDNDDWALCLAAKGGNKEIVELLLTFGMDINNRHNTPLRNAAENEHREVIKLLLKHGADDTALAEHLQWKYADEILGEGTIARMQGIELPQTKVEIVNLQQETKQTKVEIVNLQQETKQTKQQQFRRYIKHNRSGM